MLSVENICKDFAKPVLKQVSFTIREHEIVSIMGESGCGKSTLARILCGTLAADSGCATFFGEPLIDAKGCYHRDKVPRIQLVPQQPFSALDPQQKIGSAIAEPLLYHGIVKSKKEAKEQVKMLMKQVWLEEALMKRYPGQISGGQAQRVVIARALALNPKLIIADEATAMLDTSAKAQVISLLRDLVAQQKLSILLISHDKELVQSISHRGYYLENNYLREI